MPLESVINLKRMEKVMDETNFTAHMRRKGRPAGTIRSYVTSTQVYEDYLLKYCGGKSIEEVDSFNLQQFYEWGIGAIDNMYRCLAGVRAYYQFLQKSEMANAASELMEHYQNETRKLREFPKVDRECVKKLNTLGIKTVNQFLKIDQNPDALRRLAEECGSPLESIIELVKLSNLSRLPGLKKVRGRLFYEGGLDSFEKIAALQPEQICSQLTEYIQASGFEGSPPTLSEAAFTADMARYLIRDQV